MKRFTATEKWSKEWYQALKPRLKCLWQFICDNADHAGVWEPNFGLASYQIGEKVTEADLSKFGARLHKLPTGKYLIVSFIEFQFGKLSPTCPAHKPVFKAMEKNRVTDTLIDTLTSRVCDTLQEKDKEEEEDKKGSAEGKENRRRGTKEELQAYCAEIGQPRSDGAVLFEKWEGNGWRNGSAPIADWRATIRAWKQQGYLPSQRANAPPKKPKETMV